MLGYKSSYACFLESKLFACLVNDYWSRTGGRKPGFYSEKKYGQVLMIKMRQYRFATLMYVKTV